MDVYEMNEILEDHKVWLETDGKRGAKANFQRVALDFEKLQRSDLRMANFQGASLIQADLKGAKLEGANLTAADLTGANLSGAYLQNAQLNSANLTNANFAGADLRDAILMHADAVGTNFERANLTGCSVYGASVWNSKLNEVTIQSNLIITTVNEPVVTVDDLEVAQFIYLLLNRKKLRNVLDTIISKAVLFWGDLPRSVSSSSTQWQTSCAGATCYRSSLTSNGRLTVILRKRLKY
jgi:uncharacterized protein YjbI with pentapeptide repeats